MYLEGEPGFLAFGFFDRNAHRNRWSGDASRWYSVCHENLCAAEVQGRTPNQEPRPIGAENDLEEPTTQGYHLHHAALSIDFIHHRVASMAVDGDVMFY